MKLGLLSDVHGNRVALEAVVADGTAAGVDEWWALGDLVAIGPEPAETLDVIASLPGVRALRGNTERYVLTDDRPGPHADDVLADPARFGVFAAVAASFAWTRGYLRASGWIDWIDELPLEQRAALPDGTRLLAVHASPGRDDGIGITPDADETALASLLDGAAAELVCAGHTHRPANRVVGDVRAVNLGSVSNPITSDLRASYAIVHADRHETVVEHRRVTYDAERFLERLGASGHPGADFIASFQRGEQVKYRA